jgi:hypothetical protein
VQLGYFVEPLRFPLFAEIAAEQHRSEKMLLHKTTYPLCCSLASSSGCFLTPILTIDFGITPSVVSCKPAQLIVFLGPGLLHCDADAKAWSRERA